MGLPERFAGHAALRSPEVEGFEGKGHMGRAATVDEGKTRSAGSAAEGGAGRALEGCCKPTRDDREGGGRARLLRCDELGGQRQGGQAGKD